MGIEQSRSALARYGRIITSTTLSVVLATTMTPAAALADQAGGNAAADQAVSSQAADAAQPASVAKPASEDEVAVGCLKYRLDDSDNTACVVDFEDYSGRPDNLIIPSIIEVGGTAYTVTAIGDADDVSAGQICGKESLTIPETVTTLHGIPFAMEGDYYFLGKAPQVPDDEATTFFMMWGGNEVLDDGNVYCLAENLSEGYEWNEYTFSDWESTLNIIWASNIFAVPTSIQLQDAAGEDKAGSEVTLLAGQSYQLKANSQPSHNASKFVDFQTAVTWSSSDESVAKVDATGKVEVQSSAAAGSKAAITATNALGLSASLTVAAGNSAVKTDISTLAYRPQSIGDVYLGLPSIPAVTVSDGAYELVEGKDFTVSYEKADGTPLAGLDAIDAAGSYNLVITGAGDNYEGSIKVPFNVVEQLTCGDWTFKPISADAAEIVGFAGSASAGNVVVPAQLDGYSVAQLAAGSLSNAKAADGAIVIPDTVQSIDPAAFEGAQAKTIKLLGTVSADQEAVALPDGAQVSHFGDEAAFKAVFGEGCSYVANDVPWVYQVCLASSDGGATAAGVIAAADGASAFRGQSGAKAQATVPSSIDGVSIGQLGAGALSGLELAVLTVPASVAQLGEGSLDGLSGTVRFEGACDASAKPGNVAKARVYYASDQEESWKSCDWVEPAGSYDPAWDMAYDAEARGWTVAGRSDSATDLAIPEKYCGSDVVGIAAGAFPAAGNLNSVSIPGSVRSIADGAFTGIACDVSFDGNPPAGESYSKEFAAADGSTASIVLRYRLSNAAAWQASEWVTGGAYRTEVYGDCVASDYTYASTDTPGEYVITGYTGSSKSIQLPSTISDVAAQVDGSDATISGTVVGIADEAFSGRLGMKQIIVPGTVRSIGQAAFFNCRALDCVLIQGNALETIGEQAFWYTNALTSIDLPASVKSIGSGAFISQALTDINIAKGGRYYQSIDGVVFSADGTHLAVYPMGRTDEFYQVPDGVTHIDDQAFRGDHNKALNDPGLKEIALPDGLQSIGWRAFCNIKSLETISIPDSVTDLGTYAFEFDYKLTSVKLPSGLTKIPAGLLSSCDSLASVDIPAGVTAIGERAFDRCPLTQLDLPADLKTIGELAFERCQVEDLVLPASLEAIDNHAFYLADKIKGIDFAENGSLKTLGIGVFAGCDSLTEVTIPNTVETMGNAVFGSCVMLGKVTFEQGCKLTTIPHGAFENNSALHEITIPASITRVDDMAFYNCMGLKDAGDGEPGRVIFLNQGEWELGSDVFTYGTSFEPYEVNALGYNDSSTPTFFSEDRFGSLDIVFNDNDMPGTANVAVHDPLELSVSAYAGYGDITYQWFVNEVPVEGATGKSFTYVGDEKGTFAVTVRAYNSYDPEAPAMLASRVIVGDAGEVAIDRLAGEQASDTAAEVAASAFPNGSDWVVIAREDDFRDAMTATGLAGALDAPILLTDRNGLSDSAVDAILRLGAKHAYVIGGKGAMPGDFEGQLADLGVQVGSDLRVFGNEAEDTAVACAKLIAQIDGAGESAAFDKAIVTMQDNFADALSMSSFAYKYHVPILIESSGSTSADRALSADAVQLLTEGAFADATVYVPGGKAAVSDESLVVLGRGEGKLVRLTEGQTAYDTSNAIASYLVEQGFLSARAVTVAAGYLESNGVDALAGAALAGKAGGVMLLVNGTDCDGGVDTTTVEGFLTDKADYVRELHVLGGAVVMPEGIVDAVKDAVKRS